MRQINFFTKNNGALTYLLLIFVFAVSSAEVQAQDQQTPHKSALEINEAGYFYTPGLNVLVYNNTFPEGHQGGVEIIQHGVRVATNGELRLSPSPGQWQPIPKLGEGYEARGVSPQNIGLESRVVDSTNNEIRMPLSYPSEDRNRRGFNPIIYPDLNLDYTVRVKAEGQSFRIIVDLKEPLPEKWVGRIGYNLELYPGDLYGKTYFMDDSTGMFPRQANGPAYLNEKGEAEAVPLASGNELIVAPESASQRITIERVSGGALKLLDGSMKHNNGWFVVRSLVPAGVTKGAIEWKITPNVISNWVDQPVVHVSQVGFHPDQSKKAYIELDKRAVDIKSAVLQKLQKDGTYRTVKEQQPEVWGNYLRYKYLNFNFSDITEPGKYRVKYGDQVSSIFGINSDIYSRHVWQPTLEYFLPVQMCHMRVNDKYRVWHGAGHMDDALMAPTNIKHFDGYNNEDEPSTLTKFGPLDHVPGLDKGGWHDAGDYDLRIESQAQTVLALAQTYDEFQVDYDATYINEEQKFAEIHHPDGKPDILQQVEHGVLTILGGYESLGQFYRGIIVPTLRQYVHLGDATTQTDGVMFDNEEQKAEAAAIDGLWFKKVANRYSAMFDPGLNLDEIEVNAPKLDDRLVFTETNPGRKLLVGASLSAASRVLKGYNDDMAERSLEVAREVWGKYSDAEGNYAQSQKVQYLTEMIKTTGEDKYKTELCRMESVVKDGFSWMGWSVGRVFDQLSCSEFKQTVINAAKAYKPNLKEQLAETPFGSPIDNSAYFGFRSYYLHKAWPDIFSAEPLFNSVNMLLGARPGNTTDSRISGVGANSPTTAYGFNRADWSYIPGGTFWDFNIVEPDFAEDKVWPFIWQEREYIITAPVHYMFNVLAVQHLLSNDSR